MSARVLIQCLTDRDIAIHPNDLLHDIDKLATIPGCIAATYVAIFR